MDGAKWGGASLLSAEGARGVRNPHNLQLWSRLVSLFVAACRPTTAKARVENLGNVEAGPRLKLPAASLNHFGFFYQRQLVNRIKT